MAPIGADFSPAVGAFRSYLEAHKYDVIEIKVTDVFQLLEKYIPPERPLKRTPLQDRYQTHIDYGNQLRKIFGNAVLAQTVINRIIRRRTRVNRTQEEKYSKVAFLIHQFKRKEEVDLLRSVYGRLFMQISVYSRRGARVDYLSRRFADSRNSAMAQQFRAEAESLIQRDENEMDVPHGQTVGKIFHDADFIVRTLKRKHRKLK